MDPSPIELDEDDLPYLVPTDLPFGEPPRRTGRLPRAAAEVNRFHADVVPMHWLLDDLVAGRRREELRAALVDADVALVRAFGYALADMARRDASALLEAIVAEAPEPARRHLQETALDTVRSRAEDAARLRALEEASAGSAAPGSRRCATR